MTQSTHDKMMARFTENAKAMKALTQQLESTYHPCTSILIEGLKKLKAWDVLAEWDRAREIVDERVRTTQPEQQAEPVQEPVATVTVMTQGVRRDYSFQALQKLPDGVNNLYTTPPQRQ